MPDIGTFKAEALCLMPWRSVISTDYNSSSVLFYFAHSAQPSYNKSNVRTK